MKFVTRKNSKSNANKPKKAQNQVKSMQKTVKRRHLKNYRGMSVLQISQDTGFLRLTLKHQTYKNNRAPTFLFTHFYYNTTIYPKNSSSLRTAGDKTELSLWD